MTLDRYERLLDQIDAYLRAHRYIRVSERGDADPEAYIAHLRQGVKAIDETLTSLQKRYRYRGLSNAALTALHAVLKQPAWGIEIRSF